MKLKDKISEDIKNAMKAKDSQRLSVLRMVLSEIKYAQAQTNAQADISDEDVLKVVASYAKKLDKGLGDFPEGEKRDAVKAEIAIVNEYLPKKASEAEVSSAIDKVLAKTADRNFGAVMKLVMAELGSAADGKTISAILKAKLG